MRLVPVLEKVFRLFTECGPSIVALLKEFLKKKG